MKRQAIKEKKVKRQKSLLFLPMTPKSHISQTNPQQMKNIE